MGRVGCMPPRWRRVAYGPMCREALGKRFGAEPLGHNLQCGQLLAHDQHGLPASNAVTNHVDNGLALACSGWTLNDKAGPLPCLENGGFLGGVTLGDEEAAMLGDFWKVRVRKEIIVHAQRCFKSCALRRSSLQLTQVFADRLPGKLRVEEHGCTDDLTRAPSNPEILVG